MQLYSEYEKAFLLIHFNLDYGTDLLPYKGSLLSLHRLQSCVHIVPPHTFIPLYNTYKSNHSHLLEPGLKCFADFPSSLMV